MASSNTTNAERLESGDSTVQQPARTVQTAVFDLGGVLIDWNPRYLYLQLGASEEDAEWFLEHVCTPEWNHQQDAGRPFAEAVEERIEAFPDYEEWIRLYFERWEEMLGGPVEGSVAVLRELHESGTPLFALTNWSAETFPYALDRYDFLDLFDGVVVSGKIGMAKPDADIYHHLVERFGLDPAETVFIDDTERNVAAAARLGFHAIQFEGAGPLRTELERLGLL